MALLTRQMLIDAKACRSGMRSFNARVGNGDSYDFTAAEAARIHAASPRFLAWLEFDKQIVAVLDGPGLPASSTRLATFNAHQAQLGKVQR